MIALALLLALGAASPSRVTVFTGPLAAGLLRQCSRGAPAAAGLWVPAAAQVARGEALIPAALARQGSGLGLRVVDLADLRRRWRVEATGVTGSGRRLLYLNFVPLPDQGPTTGPTIVCDGGPRFFGASVDLATGRVVALDFNGMV